MSGRRVGLPAGTTKTGTPLIRSRAAAWTGGGPSFQSPSEASTIPRRFWIFSNALASGSCRSVPRPGWGGENGWTTTFIRSRNFSHDADSASGATASRRDCGLEEDFPLATTSRVSMLGEASQSTATDGFSSGRYSSIHSGWFSMAAAMATRASRSSSSSPIERL